MKPIKIIHIDDEPQHVEIFKMLVSELPMYEYIAGFTDPEEAIRYCWKHPADIVCTDISMQDKDGFWVAGQLQKLQVIIVFVTSHAEYATRAFEACALQFITKPFSLSDFEKLAAQFYRIQQTFNAIQYAEQVAEAKTRLQQTAHVPEKLYIHKNNASFVIHLAEVIYMESSGPYTHFIMSNGDKHVAARSIKMYQESLEQNTGMVRIHRSYIVNKDFVVQIRRDKHKIFVVLKNGKELEMSASRKEEIYAALLK